MSLPAISKHLKVLERAGLIARPRGAAPPLPARGGKAARGRRLGRALSPAAIPPEREVVLTRVLPERGARGRQRLHKDPDGTVFHTYSAYARGLDMLVGTYNYLDLVPNDATRRS
jgi:hypothetical protein